MSARAANGAKSTVRSSVEWSIHDRQRMVTVAIGAAMARNMFEHRQHATLQQTGAGRAPEQRHGRRLGGERAVADDLVPVGLADVEHRRAIHENSQLGQLRGEQARVQKRGFEGRLFLATVQSAEYSGRRRRPPAGRLQPLHAPAFLIDEHRRIRSAYGCLQLIHERPDLAGVLAIAGKQNEAERVRVDEESALLLAQR